MATPLQIISINSLERAILYQTYTRDSIVVVQQERKMRHRKASPFNDLDPGSREFDEWVTKNHMMLPNYLLDQIGILIHSRKQVYESCCVTESYPALKRTDIQDPTCLIVHREKYCLTTIANRSPYTKIRKDPLEI